MINSSALLTDLRRLLRVLEADLRARIDEQASLSEGLQVEWKDARDAGRTGITYTEWLDDEITQAAVHWVLGCVYLRFLEDNHYLERPYFAGPDQARLSLAQDRHEQYFRVNPNESDREYVLSCFRDVAQLPGMRGLFDERHNPVFRIGLSGDGAMQLLGFWQKVNPDTGLLVHDFSDPESTTRFLGDLYQDLSEPARKHYALLQTPVFVEEFILDRTLTPAIDEFGYRQVRLIDPTCGSGHFVLGAFQRLFDLWARNEPARNLGDLVQRALDGVYGVDLNPYAVAIARFRLLIAALKPCGMKRLKDAPAFRVNLAAGDSLLHGRRFKQLDLGGETENLARSGLAHAYQIEDLDEVNRILSQQYHAVVGNPPYITMKDGVLNHAYRARYSSCHRKYSLGVPFTQRFFELALSGDGKHPAGYIGLITANSFMKREFGVKLLEEFLPTVELTDFVDTSGAYIPGHGTPTCILFGRNRKSLTDTVIAAIGLRAETERPDDPSLAPVWRDLMTVFSGKVIRTNGAYREELSRRQLAKHPWTFLGGGEDTKELIEAHTVKVIRDFTSDIGFGAILGEDEAYLVGEARASQAKVPVEFRRVFVEGNTIRDWFLAAKTVVVYPYDQLGSLVIDHGLDKWFWPYRTLLGDRKVFGGKTYRDAGRHYYAYHQMPTDRNSRPHFLTLAFVATHNNFAYDPGGKVFNKTAPILKLPSDKGVSDYVALLGLLNCSAVCFWLKKSLMDRGGGGIGGGLATEPWERFYDHDGTKIGSVPVPAALPGDLAQHLTELAARLTIALPEQVCRRSVPTKALLEEARQEYSDLRKQMIAVQEELDWRCYRLYGLVEEPLELSDPPGIELGQRAFEIVLARAMEEGEVTTWFDRHGVAPTVDVPKQWADGYRGVVEKRIATILANPSIALIERPEFKRRWNWERWKEQEQRALRAWLLDWLEHPRYWQGEPQLKSVAKLADGARLDAEFIQVAEIYTGRKDFDASALVGELVESESVAFLPVLRYADSGLRKHAEWETCWAKQRGEDTIDAQVAAENPRRADESKDDHARRLTAEQKQRKAHEVGNIPVPPKYKSADFQSSTFWRLRGGLDVPKERFVSYPHCARDADGSLVITWAGWDHLQQATALASYYLDMKENEGWPPERLKPLLTGIHEIVPWLKQWHNEYNAEHATRMGDYFESFVVDEARVLGFTLDDLRAWTPPARQTAGRGRKRKEAVS